MEGAGFEQRRAKEGAEAWITARVALKEPAAEGIVRFELESATGETLPGFDPGAHIDVRLPNGLIRQYSLSGSPGGGRRYEIAVLLEAQGRGGSRCAHDQVKAGMALDIGVPRNAFPLVAAPHSILCAGGIGITPILAMAEQLERDGASFEMHYCCRSIQRAAFLTRLREAGFSHRVHLHFDDGAAAQAFDASRVLKGADAGSHLYVCGPKGFMDHVIGVARESGFPAARIHFEYFAATTGDKSSDAAFDVCLAGSDVCVRVEPGQTVVEALAAYGILVPVSCEQGICGTCVMKVLDGIPEHRDTYLTDAERAANTCFTPCCSRARSATLVIAF